MTHETVYKIIYDAAKRKESAEILAVIYETLKPLVEVPPETEKKVMEIIAYGGVRERKLIDDVRDWVECVDGIFEINDIKKSLAINDRQSEKNLSDYLKKLEKQGKIEKYGNKRGVYRPIENGCEQIELKKLGGDLKIQYPLGIETLCKTYPKNIIMVAGEPNAGKTAFLLRFAMMNMHHHDVHYFSSEMGQDELVDRLEMFEINLKSWKVKFWDRAADFQDVIKPNAINIIDFLEVHQDFWIVGAMVKKIFDKLDKGIAVIALQKNPTSRDKQGNVTNYLGLSGYRGAEKARIYVTMGINKEGNNIAHIVKGKNWQQKHLNPNKLEKEFRLISGCNFKGLGTWKKQEDAKYSEYPSKNNDKDWLVKEE